MLHQQHPAVHNAPTIASLYFYCFYAGRWLWQRCSFCSSTGHAMRPASRCSPSTTASLAATSRGPPSAYSPTPIRWAMGPKKWARQKRERERIVQPSSKSNGIILCVCEARTLLRDGEPELPGRRRPLHRVALFGRAEVRCFAMTTTSRWPLNVLYENEITC